MAAFSCSIQCQPLRGTAEAPAAAAVTRRGAPKGVSGGRQQLVCRRPSNKNFGTGASVAFKVGIGGAAAGGVGQKEHVGRSLHLLEVVAFPEGGQQCRKKAPGLKVEAAKRVQSGRSFALSSTLVVVEGKEAAATGLCHEILKWGEAKKKERGSGVQVFECNVDPFEKNTYHFWERYDSFQFMNDTRSSPEHTKFMNDVRPLLVKPIGLAAYEYKDGQIGHMLNPVGPKGEGGLDDATGQSGTKQQSSSIGQGLGEMEEDVGSKAWGLDKLLAKVRGEDKDGGWSFKSLFGDPHSTAKN